MESNPISVAIKSIEDIMNVHENHLYPKDWEALESALASLKKMQEDGFK